MRLTPLAFRRLFAFVPLTLACAWPLSAHALFGDDEARKAIIELRQQVEASEAARKALETTKQDNDATTRRSLLDLSNQIEQLRGEVARLRGLNEQLARDVSELQRQQKDVQVGLDERLRQVEPLKITHDEVTFTAAPAEKRDFDAALELLKKSDFAGATEAYAAFLRRYPSSGYVPSALYWLGNAQYANRAYQPALETHRRLVTQFPAHLRTPEALLAMANSQVEIKDAKGARRTLEQLVKDHPQSEAAAVGKDRLARLR